MYQEPTMNKERLEQALRVVKEVQADPNKRLDLDNWMGTHYCGTVACVVGWCMQDKWFNDRGLSMGPHYGSPRYVREGVDTYEAWEAVEQFFEVSPLQASHLFSALSYLKGPTPADIYDEVIERLTYTIEHGHVPSLY
jgi:hypothetical protein